MEATVITESTGFDFIVMGAGMAGTSLAAALASTARVALVEAESQAGFHATGRSAALFAPNYGTALFRALTRASAAFLRAPPMTSRPIPCCTHAARCTWPARISASGWRSHDPP